MFNEEFIELEWIGFEFPHLLFNNDTHEIMSSHGETDIYNNREGGITTEILEEIISIMDVASFINHCTSVQNLQEQIFKEEKERNLMSLEDARLLFANTVKVEAISLKKTSHFG